MTNSGSAKRPRLSKSLNAIKFLKAEYQQHADQLKQPRRISFDRQRVRHEPKIESMTAVVIQKHVSEVRTTVLLRNHVIPLVPSSLEVRLL